MSADLPLTTGYSCLPDDLAEPIIAAGAPLYRTLSASQHIPGFPGFSLQTSTTPSVFAELSARVLPALRDAGINALLVPLPSAHFESFRSATKTLSESKFLIPIYGFDGEPIAEDEDDIDPESAVEAAEPGRPTTRDRGRTLCEAGVLHAVEGDHAIWQDRAGESRTDSLAAFRVRFSVAVRMGGAARRPTRRVGLQAAIDRAVLFSLAFPGRLVTGIADDAPRREDAAMFLLDAAGKQRDSIALRWRQAAGYLRDDRVNEGLERLYDAMLRSLDLPSATHAALAWPQTRLTAVEERDLIYLARAGSRQIKILAAGRLASNRETAGVRQTLLQLTLSPDPLVRGAAASSLLPETGR